MYPTSRPHLRWLPFPIFHTPFITSLRRLNNLVKVLHLISVKNYPRNPILRFLPCHFQGLPHKFYRPGFLHFYHNPIFQFRRNTVPQPFKVILFHFFRICQNQIISQFRNSGSHTLVPVPSFSDSAVAGVSSGSGLLSCHFPPSYAGHQSYSFCCCFSHPPGEVPRY